MQYRQLGRSKIEISAIIFGGWQAGKSGWTGINDDDTIAAHRAAFDSGITTFDTAEAYGEGLQRADSGAGARRQARSDRHCHQSLGRQSQATTSC